MHEAKQLKVSLVFYAYFITWDHVTGIQLSTINSQRLLSNIKDVIQRWYDINWGKQLKIWLRADCCLVLVRDRFVVFNATFNNISVISWWSVLLMEGTWAPGENRRPVTSHWET